MEIEKRKKENKNDKKIEWLSDEDKDLISTFFFILNYFLQEKKCL